MSRLEFFARPLVEFDPTNKEHRSIYNEFIKKPGWGHSPYRFICPDVHGSNLVSMIQQKMLEFYIKKEFAVGGRPKQCTVPKKPHKAIAQKAVKLVDTTVV